MTTRRRRPRRTVSPERKNLYLVGIGMQAIGGLGVIVCFIGFTMTGFMAAESFGERESPMPWFVGFAICAAFVGGGAAVCRVAARGVAGSGLVLDPQRAKADLEPWARTAGGLVRDVVDEAGVGRTDGNGERAEPDVKVRCRECRTLNDEDAKFCDNCGTAL